MDTVTTQLSQQLRLPLQSPVLIFSLILFIILLAPLLLERIRVPSLIGLIISGVAIGPHGFNILENGLFVKVFSTIGLLYIMFLAGLDLNLIEFKINRYKSYVFAAFTFCLPFALGFPACYYLLGMDFYASLLVASVFATHTLVTYPIVSRLDLSKDLSVAVTVGGTIITDTAVLVVLAVIIGAHAGNLTSRFWLQLAISVALFCAFVFVLVPRVGGWFFEALDKEKHSHYIFVLAVVFLCAFMADLAGLEAIIGAFAAGLALNKLIPNSSALMNRIAFIGNSLFIPFFLISVGMLVDLRVVLSGAGVLAIAAVLTLVAMAGKYAAAQATRLVFSFSRDQGNLIFGLSSAHAAATLAVVLVGYRQKIVGDTVLNAIVIIILTSCMVASFVTAAAAEKLRAGSAEKADAAPPSGPKMEQILVSLAAAEKVEDLLHFAVLIKDKASTLPLVLLDVVPNTADAESRIVGVKQATEALLSEAIAAETEVKVMATIDQSVAHGIARSARELNASVILFGWPRSDEPFDGVPGNTLQDFLVRTNKTLFICNLRRPIEKNTGLFLLTPPRAELEAGFAIWLAKLLKLSVELSVPIKLHGTAATLTAVKPIASGSKLTLNVEFTPVDTWEDFLLAFRELADSDLLVVVSARRGSHSHHGHLDELPAKLTRYLAGFNKILVYPQ
jgi:Kef-type K+ transport system membrane component KefB